MKHLVQFLLYRASVINCEERGGEREHQLSRGSGDGGGGGDVMMMVVAVMVRSSFAVCDRISIVDNKRERVPSPAI